MDFETPAERLGLDVDEYLELVQLFLESGASDIKGIEDGLSSGDAQTVVERSHSLKGASGNLGITEIYEKAKDIENRARENNLDDIDSMILEIKQYFKNIADSLES